MSIISACNWACQLRSHQCEQKWKNSAVDTYNCTILPRTLKTVFFFIVISHPFLSAPQLYPLYSNICSVLSGRKESYPGGINEHDSNVLSAGVLASNQFSQTLVHYSNYHNIIQIIITQHWVSDLLIILSSIPSLLPS